MNKNELLHTIKENCCDIKRIGVLGTFEICKIKLHENYLKNLGQYELVYPSEDGKNNLYDAVNSLEYGIKALSNPITRKAKRLIKEEIDKFIKNGIKCIILGCTECYLAFAGEQYYKNVLFIDIHNDIVIEL